jgi:hypothetical protein
LEEIFEAISRVRKDYDNMYIEYKDVKEIILNIIFEKVNKNVKRSYKEGKLYTNAYYIYNEICNYLIDTLKQDCLKKIFQEYRNCIILDVFLNYFNSSVFKNEEEEVISKYEFIELVINTLKVFIDEKIRVIDDKEFVITYSTKVNEKRNKTYYAFYDKNSDVINVEKKCDYVWNDLFRIGKTTVPKSLMVYLFFVFVIKYNTVLLEIDNEDIKILDKKLTPQNLDPNKMNYNFRYNFMAFTYLEIFIRKELIRINNISKKECILVNIGYGQIEEKIYGFKSNIFKQFLSCFDMNQIKNDLDLQNEEHMKNIGTNIMGFSGVEFDEFYNKIVSEVKCQTFKEFRREGVKEIITGEIMQDNIGMGSTLYSNNFNFTMFQMKLKDDNIRNGAVLVCATLFNSIYSIYIKNSVISSYEHDKLYLAMLNIFYNEMCNWIN